MTGHEIQELYNKAMAETEPNKLSGLDIPKLESSYNSLHYIRQHLSYTGSIQQCDARMELIRRELELKKLTDQSETHHQQTFGQGKKILRWTRCAVVAAVLVPIAIALIQEILPSKLRPAKASQSQQPSPASAEPSSQPQQTATPPSESPTASTEESPQ